MGQAMSWQNWVVSWLARNRIKKPTERLPFDPIATRVNAETRSMPMPVRLPPDWRIVRADGALPGEWIEPADPDSLGDAPPVVFYLHGGGYFFCSPRTHRSITIGLAVHARARVFALDYRLAPEHPFPAAVLDALAGYRGLLAQRVAPSRIVVAGDSAGGGLSLALLVALRDAGDPLPAGAILYSPWTDLAATGASLVENDASDVMFRGAWMARGATLYLGDSGVPADHPLASPLYADFTGLPPLHCYVSTSEVLRDDTLRMAERARAAGVSVSVELGRRLPHVWPIFYPFLPEARKALRQSGDAVRRMTAGRAVPAECAPA
ncbi:alpha/beta hydrolase [Ralstonia solanacearum]|uniref:6-hexanolactone hydrolase n=2 Tax=Ralstonia solanacearum species complex TaxID=3116862 RepID=A0A0S4V6D4_RALSL|nr:alpha/beta hydrolase [Ralstonia solanacearum]CUV30194.1 6-hexanolactone hydrolase [Ralstonia solanacearum]